MIRLLLLAALSSLLIGESEPCISREILQGNSLPNKKEHPGTLHTGQIGELIQLYTKESREDIQHKYLHYGCFCGLGGGGKPVDPTDTCCFNHDKCYDDTRAQHAPDKSNMAFIFLEYHYYTNTTSPDLPDDVRCDRENDKASFGKCDCDRKLASCLKNASNYKSEYASRDVIDDKCNRD